MGGGTGAGPDAARVVAVAAARPDVAVVELAWRVLRAVMVVVVDDAIDVDVGAWPWAAAVVVVVSALRTLELVVLLGGPATAN